MFQRVSNMVRYKLVLKDEVRKMTNSTAIQMDNTENIVTRKMNDLIKWYERVTGMDEVRVAQNRVLEEEMKFISAQERRREANKLVSAVQSKLKDLYAELDNTTRGEERYVHLITEEHKLLKEERKLVEEFQHYEKEEREYFAVLSSAVKESHEKERAQAERTKYWSIIGSIIGTVIGIAGSSINNHLKMKEFRQLVKESTERAGTDSAHIPELLRKQEQQLTNIVTEIRAVSGFPNNQVLNRLDEMSKTVANNGNISNESSSDRIDSVISLLKHQQSTMENNFKELESKVLTKYASVSDITSDTVVLLPTQLEQQLLVEQQQMKYILVCCTIVAVVMPIVCRYL